MPSWVPSWVGGGCPHCPLKSAPNELQFLWDFKRWFYLEALPSLYKNSVRKPESRLPVIVVYWLILLMSVKRFPVVQKYSIWSLQRKQFKPGARPPWHTPRTVSRLSLILNPSIIGYVISDVKRRHKTRNDVISRFPDNGFQLVFDMCCTYVMYHTASLSYAHFLIAK